jgi:hypothetical protein
VELICQERREAAAELLAQARYYVDQRAGLGTAFMDAVDAAIGAIEAFPDAAGPYPGWEGSSTALSMIRRGPTVPGRLPPFCGDA